MNERQLEYFRRKLLAWKAELLDDSKTHDRRACRTAARNIPDVADRASEETDRALELRTRDRQRKLVAKIDAALRRIDERRVRLLRGHRRADLAQAARRPPDRDAEPGGAGAPRTARKGAPRRLTRSPAASNARRDATRPTAGAPSHGVPPAVAIHRTRFAEYSMRFDRPDTSLSSAPGSAVWRLPSRWHGNAARSSPCWNGRRDHRGRRRPADQPEWRCRARCARASANACAARRRPAQKRSICRRRPRGRTVLSPGSGPARTRAGMAFRLTAPTLVEVLATGGAATGRANRAGARGDCDVAHTPTGVGLTSPTERTESVPFLVGADGAAWSELPRAGGRRRLCFTGQVAWRAMVPADGDRRARASTWGPGAIS